MPSTVVKSIKEAGGDYTTVTAWEAALPADLTVSDEIQVGELYRNTVEDVTIAGSTTDATRYIVLCGGSSTASDVYKHRGKLCGAQATLYGSLTVSVGNMTVRDLAIVDDSAKSISDGAASVTLTLERLIVQAITVGIEVENASTILADACVVIRAASAGFHCDDAGGTLTLKNCDALDGGTGFLNTAGTVAATNCIASGNTTDYLGTITQVNCAASDATADGTLPLDNLTAAQWARFARANPDLVSFWNGMEETGDLQGKLGRAAVMRKAGALLGTLQGTAGIAGGKLTCDASGESLTFTAPAGQVPGVEGAIVTAFTPNYSGTPGTATSIFSAQPASASFANIVFLQHNASTGELQVLLYEADATAFAVIGASAWVPVAGRKYIISVTWSGFDGSAGTAQGKVVVYDTVAESYSTEVTFTGQTKTRDESDTDGTFYIGSNQVPAQPCEGDIGFVEVYDTTSPAFRGDLTSETWRIIDLPLYRDAEGALDDFALTLATIQALKWGGATAGATADAANIPMGDRPCRGVLIGRRQPAMAAS